MARSMAQPFRCLSWAYAQPSKRGREERSIKSVSDSQSPLETPDPAIGETPSPVLQLGQDDEGTFEVDANVLATGRTCIIGASGSGKSYAVGVICEELCKSRVPFAIIDTEGEHSGLKEKYDAVCIGDEPSCDLQWSGLDLEHLGAQAPDLAPLILDLSESDEQKQKVSDLLSSIYREV